MESGLWAFALTFRLPVKLSTEPNKYKPLRQFMRELMDSEQITVAYIGVYAPYPNPHIHLALTYQSKGAPKLIDFPRYETRWNQIIRYTSGGLHAKRIFDSKGWQDYVMHNAKNPYSLTFWYNKELLEQQHLGV